MLSKKNSLLTLGPKMFNYFVNTINLAQPNNGKQKLKIEKLSPTTFKNYTKEQLIDTQGSNDPVNWDPTNFPFTPFHLLLQHLEVPTPIPICP